MKKHNQNGFAHYVLVFSLVLVLGVVGFLAYKNVLSKINIDSEKTTQNEADKKQDTSSSKQDYKWSQMPQGPYHDSVYYITSDEIDKWPNTPGELLQEHASVPDVLYKDGNLYVYFVDVSTDGEAEKIGLRISSDYGDTWTERQFINIEGIEDRIPVDPAPILLDDGRIRIFYLDFSTAQSGSKHSIYSAISNDGVNFVQEEGVRFEYSDIYDPDVVKFDDYWRLYVGTGDLRVISATSTDGLDFNYEGVAYSGGAIPNVILDDSVYYLFTGGIDISTSTDGKSFVKSNSHYNPGQMAADPGITRLTNGKYFMVYKSSDIKPTDPPIN